MLLAGIEPAWTLSGGAALAGFHTKHRETRDLDLFFRGQRSLGAELVEVDRRLADVGFSVTTIQSGQAFGRRDVRHGADSIIVDLVADPVRLAEPPLTVQLGATTILVDTPHQLLVNKLCALLSRSELRDLVDVRALLQAGADLTRALGDSPEQDGGFSPLTFAWALGQLPVRRLANNLSWPEAEVASLEKFRDLLVDRVLAASRPDE